MVRRKLNNKGMTAIEILVTFLIVAVIVVSLYDGIVALKDKETISSYKLSLVTYRDLLTKDIQDDLIKIGLAGAEISSMSDGTGYRVTFTLRDGSKRVLEVKQVFGCNAADTGEEDELCVKAGIAKDASDSFSISYGLPGDVVEYPLPDLGNEAIPNLHSSGTHTISALRINEVDISTANRVFSLRVTLHHPDLGSRYSIDIVSPINYRYGSSSGSSVEPDPAPDPDPEPTPDPEPAPDSGEVKSGAACERGGDSICWFVGMGSSAENFASSFANSAYDFDVTIWWTTSRVNWQCWTGSNKGWPWFNNAELYGGFRCWEGSACYNYLISKKGQTLNGGSVKSCDQLINM